MFTEEQKEKIKSFEVIRYRKKIARYIGDKSNTCPRCSHRAYYVAKGKGGRVRRKECSWCNFDSSLNEYSITLKSALRRGNLDLKIHSQYFQKLYEIVLPYQQSLVPLTETIT